MILVPYAIALIIASYPAILIGKWAFNHTMRYNVIVAAKCGLGIAKAR